MMEENKKRVIIHVPSTPLPPVEFVPREPEKPRRIDWTGIVRPHVKEAMATDPEFRRFISGTLAKETVTGKVPLDQAEAARIIASMAPDDSPARDVENLGRVQDAMNRVLNTDYDGASLGKRRELRRAEQRRLMELSAHPHVEDEQPHAETPWGSRQDD